MTIKPLAILSTALAAAALLASPAAAALAIKHIPLPPSQNPTAANRPVSGAVWAGDTLYVSGWLDPDYATHRDTKAQTIGIYEDLQKFLKTQHLTLGDVVMMHVYIGGDPAKGGKPDLEGTRAVYPLFFGAKDQPGKPACTAIEVALPSGPLGALVEVDLVAVRSR